ncbi:hypothetical protein, partial [Oceanithermus profundus]
MVGFAGKWDESGCGMSGVGCGKISFRYKYAVYSLVNGLFEKAHLLHPTSYFLIFSYPRTRQLKVAEIREPAR